MEKGSSQKIKILQEELSEVIKNPSGEEEKAVKKETFFPRVNVQSLGKQIGIIEKSFD